MIIALSLVCLIVGAIFYLATINKWSYIGLVMFGAGVLAFLLLGSPYFVAVLGSAPARLH